MVKIVAYVAPMRLLVLDNGQSIPVSEFPSGRIGMDVEMVDGKWRTAQTAEACEV